jgi:hypothetical protein
MISPFIQWRVFPVRVDTDHLCSVSLTQAPLTVDSSPEQGCLGEPQLATSQSINLWLFISHLKCHCLSWPASCISLLCFSCVFHFYLEKKHWFASVNVQLEKQNPSWVGQKRDFIIWNWLPGVGAQRVAVTHLEPYGPVGAEIKEDRVAWGAGTTERQPLPAARYKGEGCLPPPIGRSSSEAPGHRSLGTVVPEGPPLP